MTPSFEASFIFLWTKYRNYYIMIFQMEFKKHIFNISAVCAAVLSLLWHQHQLSAWMMDDSFIFFRYAKNWAAGAGIVYNPGEFVEGYTSFLWLFILTLGAKAGFELTSFAKAAGMLFSTASIFLVSFSSFFLRTEKFEYAGGAAVLLLASSMVFLPWSASGMETPLFSFLLLLALFYYARVSESEYKYGFFTSGALFAMAFLARPEGAMVFAVIFFSALISKRPRALSRNLFFAYGFASIAAPFLFWRYLYYGALLPNTFHAKIGFTPEQLLRGAAYFADFCVSSFPVVFLTGFMFFFVREWKEIGPKFFILPAAAFIYTIYIIAVGGDFMYAFRFFAPLMPAFCVISAYSAFFLIGRLSAGSRTRVSAKTVIAISVFYLLIQNSTHPELFGLKESEAVTAGTEIGLLLKRNAPENAVLAVNTAGIIPFYSELYTIDMLGLTNKEIASRSVKRGSGQAGHENGDGAFVLSKKPFYIVFGNFLGQKAPLYKGDKEILQSAEFKNDYILKVYKLEKCEKFFTVYERK